MSLIFGEIDLDNFDVYTDSSYEEVYGTYLQCCTCKETLETTEGTLEVFVRMATNHRCVSSDKNNVPHSIYDQVPYKIHRYFSPTKIPMLAQ